jgi:hypothetical protein
VQVQMNKHPGIVESRFTCPPSAHGEAR